jgi:hypothetical protein
MRAVNLLDASGDIHGRKEEMLVFFSVPVTKQDYKEFCIASSGLKNIYIISSSSVLRKVS